MLRRSLRLLGSVHLAPVRFFRRRIMVQLIASHAVVVILAVLLLEAAAIASFFGYFPSFLPEEITYLDYTMGEKARTISFMLGPTTIERLTSNEALAVERTATSLRLLSVIDPDNAGTSDTTAPMQMEGVARIAILSPAGQVVLSTEEDWAAPGTTVDEIAFDPAANVTMAVINRGGAVNHSTGERYAMAVQGKVTAAAYPVLKGDGELVGVVLVQRWPLNLSEIVSFREFIGDAFRSNLRYFWYVAIPALVVAIPVGVWRARRVSTRLSSLASAAESMARGDLSRRVAISGDDEISRVGRRFNDMAERLAAGDRSRRSFAANVSHELRTPIAIIQGNLEQILDRQNGATANEAATLRVVHAEAVTLSRLIDDLFTLTRLEESALPMELAKLRVDEAVAQAVAALKPLAWDQRKVTMESVVRPGLPFVLADRTRLQQILHNLLYNALRHTPEGGLIIVDAHERVDVGDVQISITDTGVGIPPEVLESIFDRYYPTKRRGDQTREGSGLGLHLVKQLVEAQDGRITIESIPSQGTTVRFTLPRA
ncbi:MAG: sensor histidine kinase [Thermomicrobiales bacterium]